jgi:hypothetical protein
LASDDVVVRAVADIGWRPARSFSARARSTNRALGVVSLLRVSARAAAGIGFAGGCRLASRIAARASSGACPDASRTRSRPFGIRGLFSQTLHFLAHPTVELLERAVELLIQGRSRFVASGRRSRGRLGARRLAGVAGRAATLSAGRRFMTSTGPASPLFTLLALTDL